MGISECNKLGYNFELNIDGYLENKLINLIRELIHKLNLKNQIHINGKYTQEKATLVYNNNDAFIFLIYRSRFLIRR